MRVYTGGVEERRTTAADMVMPTTAATTKVGEAGRLPSIEMEPKTLTLDQIKNAREAALYVVSTKTEEEAIRIFTAGLKPVQVNVRNKSSSMDSSDDDVDLGGGLDNGFNTGGRDSKAGGGRCRRGRRRCSMDDIRDIATAPL